MNLTYPILEVYWYPYLNAKQSRNLYRNNNGGQWLSNVQVYYSTGIISNIKVIE